MPSRRRASLIRVVHRPSACRARRGAGTRGGAASPSSRPSISGRAGVRGGSNSSTWRCAAVFVEPRRPSPSRPAVSSTGSICSGSVRSRAGQLVQRQPALAGAARARQLAQHRQRQREAVARRVGHARHAHLQARRIGGDHRAEQHDDPAEVDPQQQDRHAWRRRRRPPSRSAPGRRTRPAALGHLEADGDEQRRRPARGASARACWARSGTAPPCRPTSSTNSTCRAASARRPAACRPARATPRSRTRSGVRLTPSSSGPSVSAAQ